MNLIAYFSRENHTKKIAIKLHELINSKIFEIKTQNPYPKNHKELLEVAKKEWENQKLPPIRGRELVEITRVGPIINF